MRPRFAKTLFLSVMMIQALLYGGPLIDLEENVQSFVLETRKIEIPGHPYAFNPSIVRWQGSLLLSFRIIPDPKASFTTYIGCVWLDDDFNVISKPQLIDLRDVNSVSPCRAEDARLITVGERLFMVYDDNVDKVITKGGFRVYLAELINDGQKIKAVDVECLSRFEGESIHIREKAWVPFVYHSDLLLAYSIAPHKIFLPILGTGECLTIDTTYPKIPWKWGELRGGTSGMLIDSHRYLSFFHSSTRLASVHSDGQEIMHYFIGAYTFSSEPPFALNEVSPEPIVGENFYNGPVYKPYWKPIRAVFPCGYIFDEQNIWITYGKDDHELWLVKLDRQGLLDSLVPVKNLAID